MIASITSNVEGFVRWVYPGLLLLVLLQLGRENGVAQLLNLGEVKDALQIFWLVTVGIVSSQVLYTFHRYIIHEWLLECPFTCGRVKTLPL